MSRYVISPRPEPLSYLVLSQALLHLSKLSINLHDSLQQVRRFNKSDDTGGIEGYRGHSQHEPCRLANRRSFRSCLEGSPARILGIFRHIAEYHRWCLGNTVRKEAVFGIQHRRDEASNLSAVPFVNQCVGIAPVEGARQIVCAPLEICSCADRIWFRKGFRRPLLSFSEHPLANR